MPALHLRPPQAADIESVMRIHGDPRTNQFNPSGPATAKQASDLLAAWLAHWEMHGFGYWAVMDAAAPSEVIGFGGVMLKNVAHLHGLNIYFRFAPEAWGKGYATELARAGLNLAFNSIGASEVFGLVRPSNMPSRRTLERVGFVQYSQARDVPREDASLIYRATRIATEFE
jgi:[ribosomal protein S5]-alanine N-acetyltransferase